MSINAIKQLLKSNNVEASTESIKAKIAELNLSATSLSESDIALVVDSFVAKNLAITPTQSASELSSKQSVETVKKKFKKGFTSTLQSDIDAFEKPIADMVERISSDEASRIYDQHIANLSDKVIAKTAELISVHSGDNKRCSDIGNQFAGSLFSDFYTKQD